MQPRDSSGAGGGAVEPVFHLGRRPEMARSDRHRAAGDRLAALVPAVFAVRRAHLRAVSRGPPAAGGSARQRRAAFPRAPPAAPSGRTGAAPISFPSTHGFAPPRHSRKRESHRFRLISGNRPGSPAAPPRGRKIFHLMQHKLLFGMGEAGFHPPPGSAASWHALCFRMSGGGGSGVVCGIWQAGPGRIIHPLKLA